VAPGAAASAAGAGRVVADLDLCQGHGVCVHEAPEVFALDPETGKVTVADPCPPAALRPKLDAAIRHCPTRALRIAEESP